jgi:hypothetical protein
VAVDDDSVLVGPESSLVVHEWLVLCEVHDVLRVELESKEVDDPSTVVDVLTVVDSSGVLNHEVDDVSAQVDEVSVSVGPGLLKMSPEELLEVMPGQSSQWL